MERMMKAEAQHYTERVERIIRFCEMLTVPDGMLVGQRVVLQPEQKRFINAVYGPVPYTHLTLPTKRIV